MKRGKNDSTVARGGARVEMLPGGVSLPGDVVAALRADREGGRDVWREVPAHFARYVRESQIPVEGPEGSGSYASPFMLCREPGGGAVHCVVAEEEGRWYARYAGLMRWAEALAELRAALAAEGGA